MKPGQVNLVSIVILLITFILLYHPVWTADFVFTDEIVHLWYYGKDPDFHMFISIGRYLTDVLMEWWFGSISTIEEIKGIRIFSFLGWLLTIPLWYLLLKDIVRREGLPQSLAFLSVFYLICMPPLTISVVWASCLELFIANTCGFLSGYFMYRGLHWENSRLKVNWLFIVLSVLLGIISLFNYQNGFGFFFLPFVVHVLSPKRNTAFLLTSVVAFVVITCLYYLIFKFSLSVSELGTSERAGLHIYPWDKVKFFFTRPMSSAFHLTYLFNEKSKAGYIIYALLFGVWLLLYWFRHPEESKKDKVTSLGILLALLMLSYLPSLLVKENYASNRTLLALHLAVFIMIFEIIFRYLRKRETQNLVISLVCLLLVFNANYNVKNLFLKPIQQEYAVLRSYFENNFRDGIEEVHFIQPQEDFFVRQYGITRSWDEFGVPSTFFSWVPKYFVYQVAFEITGDRAISEKLQIIQYTNTQEFEASGTQPSPNTLVVDVEKIIKANHKKMVETL